MQGGAAGSPAVVATEDAREDPAKDVLLPVLREQVIEDIVAMHRAATARPISPTSARGSGAAGAAEPGAAGGVSGLSEEQALEQARFLWDAYALCEQAMRLIVQVRDSSTTHCYGSIDATCAPLLTLFPAYSSVLTRHPLPPNARMHARAAQALEPDPLHSVQAQGPAAQRPS